MTLQAWQRAIGLLVVRGGSPGAPARVPDTSAVSAEEALWLEHISETAGFRVTCAVQRWWRDLRLRTAAPLTIASVPEADAETLLQRYLDTHPATTQFFLMEAVRFLDWLPDNPELAAAPHAGSIAAWERARLRGLLASQPAMRERVPRLLQTVPAAALVPFAAPPEQVLTALIVGASLPPIGEGRWDVLVVPGRPPRWRIVDPTEAHLLELCRTPQPAAALRASGANEALISRLVAEGALEAV